MRTNGQRVPIGRTIRSISATLASMSARGSFCKQMPAADHVQRQIAVAIVTAVEEAPLVMPVQRIVGGVEIEDDLLRRPLVGLQEQRHGQRLDRRPIVGEPVIR